jgi:ribosomal protein S3
LAINQCSGEWKILCSARIALGLEATASLRVVMLEHLDRVCAEAGDGMKVTVSDRIRS